MAHSVSRAAAPQRKQVFQLRLWAWTEREVCSVMPLLFSYGTLQQEHVQVSTFGRRLQGQRDELLGFEPSLVPIADPQVAAASGRTHQWRWRRRSPAETTAG